MIPIDLSRLVVNEVTQVHFCVLREQGGPRELSFPIGLFEAAALDRVLRQELHPRPLTHDLLVHVAGELGASLAWVAIDDVIDEVFFAKLYLRRGEFEIPVDARPSDALVLALQEGAPVFVAERVFRKVTQA